MSPFIQRPTKRLCELKKINMTRNIVFLLAIFYSHALLGAAARREAGPAPHVLHTVWEHAVSLACYRPHWRLLFTAHTPGFHQGQTTSGSRCMCYRVDLHMRGWALPGISCSDQGTRQMLGREPTFMNSAWTTFPGQKEEERERKDNSKKKKKNLKSGRTLPLALHIT